MDSCGIRTLVKCKNRSLEVGRLLRIIGIHGPVANVFEMCRLTE